MSIRSLLHKPHFLLKLGIVVILGIIAWFCAVTPRWDTTEVIYPDLYTDYQAPSSLVQNRSHENGLYWMKFKVAPQLFPLERLRLRIWGCLDFITTNNREWNLPTNEKLRCDNQNGMLLRQASSTFKEATTWSFSGQTNGGRYGVYLEKDWTEPILIFALGILFLVMAGMLYSTLPIQNKKWRMFAILILGAGFALRFYSVFIISPPQITLQSDMAGYFQRAVEILRGEYNLDQNFQPLGYTFWSLLMRAIGGWELLNWSQVFASWGTSLLIFLMALEYFGLMAGLFSLILATLHFPQISFASYHLAECLYTFLLTFAMWWIFRTFKKEQPWKYFVAGLLLMISFYFKGNHAVFVPLFSILLLLKDRTDLKKSLRNVSAMALGCIVIMTPHLAWTQYAYNKAMPGPTAGGLNFVEGKCPWKNNQDSAGNNWMSPLFNETGERASKKWPRPFTDQSYFWGEGIKCVQENPQIMLTSFRYIYYLFAGNELWPAGFNHTFVAVYGPWKNIYYYLLLPMSLLGFILLYLRGHKESQVLAMLMLSIFLTVYIFKSENRFRVPVDMTLIIWSGYSLSWIFANIRSLFSAKIELPRLEQTDS
ncbi:ArnT family glycosyltransferase [Bdellovibrio svalbardensis]|uniref:Glycosyltransferase family 39 protein n=1 Tax=Bdellovibrio svalbardensis TaxID=2972972 RepID=A0ABT6DFY6_9BACT|nr:glycosyltransferase family 39 protein [Bdellovibrio svalbardensis]MDG0815165.1 glycosyltransferase family 39 protein [Bdellovibrio svalbardensis]